MMSLNAFYVNSWNLIVLPAGLLNLPFFERGRPDAVNFGSLGFVVGHEVTHGFDSQGRKRNREGKSGNWWTDESAEEFEQRVQCFRDQYSSYEYEGIQVNENKTLDENIADNGGLRAAYKVRVLANEVKF